MISFVVQQSGRRARLLSFSRQAKVACVLDEARVHNTLVVVAMILGTKTQQAVSSCVRPPVFKSSRHVFVVNNARSKRYRGSAFVSHKRKERTA